MVISHSPEADFKGRFITAAHFGWSEAALLAVGQNQWYHFGVGEVHPFLSISVVEMGEKKTTQGRERRRGRRGARRGEVNRRICGNPAPRPPPRLLTFRRMMHDVQTCSCGPGPLTVNHDGVTCQVGGLDGVLWGGFGRGCIFLEAAPLPPPALMGLIFLGGRAGSRPNERSKEYGDLTGAPPTSRFL